MLSYVYRLATDFEKTHQVRANCLQLSPAHFAQLKQSFAEPNDVGRILSLLGMEVLVSEEIAHPRVLWIPAIDRRAS